MRISPESPPSYAKASMAVSPRGRHVVLIFAYHFPPEPEIGAARPGRFYKYLKRMGYDCRIITAAWAPDGTLTTRATMLPLPDNG